MEFTYFVSPRCAAALHSVVRHGVVQVPFSRQPGYVRRLTWEQVTLPFLLRTQSFDLVSSLGALAIFPARIPQVVTDHNAIHHATRQQLGTGLALVRARIERVVARMSARRADAVIYLTRGFSESMLGVGFPAPTAIIPSGVSADLHHRRLATPSEVRTGSACSDRAATVDLHAPAASTAVSRWASIIGTRISD